MTKRIVKLIDPARNVVAIAQVADEGDHYGGTIDLRCTGASVRALFEEFDEIVNTQMFSFLDKIKEEIASLSIKILFDNGHEACVKDLQVFPSTGEVSFKLAEASAAKELA